MNSYKRINATFKKIGLSYYFLECHIKKIHELINIREVGNIPLIRVGNPFDGGYIMANTFSSNDIAYSFGISNDVSWDLDIAKLGIPVYMYDHTISNLPMEHKNFHWKQIGICGNETHANLQQMGELLQENKHTEHQNIILKMDVEGAEWDFLNNVSIDILSQFSQIVFEFHGFLKPEHTYAIYTALKKLNITHQAIYCHANNHGGCPYIYSSKQKLILPKALEVTYLRKNDWQFEESTRIFPGELDRPCNKKRPDIKLGRWNISL